MIGPSRAETAKRKRNEVFQLYICYINTSQNFTFVHLFNSSQKIVKDEYDFQII